MLVVVPLINEWIISHKNETFFMVEHGGWIGSLRADTCVLVARRQQGEQAVAGVGGVF